MASETDKLVILVTRGIDSELSSVAFTIANDHDTMTQAIDRGIPIAEVRRKCALGKDIDAMDQGLAAALGLEH